MIFKTLYTKLSAALVFLLLLMGLVYGFSTLYATSGYLQNLNQQVNLDLAKNLVADRNLVQQDKINQQALKDLFHDYMMVNPAIEIYLLDLSGNILAFSAEPDKVKRKHVSLQPIQKMLKGELATGDDPRSLEKQKAFSVTYVPSQNNPDGYLYVVLQGEEYDAINDILKNSYLFKVSAWAAAISLLLGLLIGLFLFYSLTKRLRLLASAVNQFAGSGFVEQPNLQLPDNKSGDEIDQLYASFSALTAHTLDQFNQISQQDHMRRELVANVSHDLRTPVAAMQGYLETIVLNNTLSEAEKRQYLEVALRHSKRLAKLVESLFELAKLDMQEVQPNLEPFPIGELLMDVVQKFGSSHAHDGVKLECVCDESLPFVYADISLIERVMDNLIDNAFTFSKSGDSIVVTAKQAGDKVQINIADSGCGIDAEDVPKIFDQFYQAKNKHRKGSHAGLGLSIVKRILELHGETISVSSQLHKGTCFSFSLSLFHRAGD
jgi:two-component system, OmpR family, sensor kinase